MLIARNAGAAANGFPTLDAVEGAPSMPLPPERLANIGRFFTAIKSVGKERMRAAPIGLIAARLDSHRRAGCGSTGMSAASARTDHRGLNLRRGGLY